MNVLTFDIEDWFHTWMVITQNLSMSGTMHQLAYQQSKEIFEEDLKTSIELLEGITGNKARSYRAPGFSITKDTKWISEILPRNLF